MPTQWELQDWARLDIEDDEPWWGDPFEDLWEGVD